MDLNTPVREVSRPYKMYGNRLEKLGIKTLKDFLFHVPFRYDDYSLVSRINQVQPGEIVTIQGKVLEIKNAYTSKWKRLQKAKVADETGEIEVTWFNQPYLTKTIKKDDLISLSGKVGLFGSKKTLQSPDFEIIYEDKKKQTIHTGRLIPIYSETRGVSSKWLRRQVFKLLQNKLSDLKDVLPKDIIKQNNLLEIKQALPIIHFPENLEEASKAKQRLAFEELFLIQLSGLKRKKEWSKNKLKNPFKVTVFKNEIDNFISKLKFELTNAQKKAIKEIFSDFSKNKPMNRLLEGEVGSGKTVISAIAMYLTHLNDQQSVLMAPTEILANQHFATIKNVLEPLGVRVELVTSGSKIKSQKSDIIVGTHAILYSRLKQENIGFVTIDEQQRFGVSQRATLRQLGKNPHVLTMTATPIPRTVALTMYGDLDISFLDEMPKGRRKIKTWLVPPEKREGAYRWIEKEIKENKSQVFIICPLIEESENLESVRAATKEYDLLKKQIFPKLNLGLLHGRLKSKEKDTVLKKFKDKKIDILVSTPVVEVGIDIPNATIMLIEESDRFGLAQLHQLRGRVGRGQKESYCLLFTSSTNDKTIKRLKLLETIDFGPELAELDLKLRGPGQIYGTLQHGTPMLKIAHFSDFDLIKETKKEAEKIIDNIDKYPDLKKELEKMEKENISPD